MDLTDFNEVHMTITCQSGSGYGFELDATHHPLRVLSVSPGSSAYKSGLCKGDLLLMVNGHDVSQAPLARVQSIITYSSGSPITIQIARFDKEKSNKSNPPVTVGKGLQGYRDAVGDAVKSAQNALDILSDNPSTRSEQHITIDLRENGSDHSSPPTSSPDHSDNEYDPLFDFSHGMNRGEVSYDSSDHTSAKLIGNVLKAQQGLRGIKEFTETTEERKVVKKKPLVSTEASFDVKTTPLSDKPVTKLPSFNDVIATKGLKGVSSDHTSARPVGNVLKTQQVLRDVSETREERKVEKTQPLLSTETEIKTTPLSEKPVSTLPSFDAVATKNTIRTTELSPPPIIPPYNPASPDRFLLSNKPEYQLEVKKQRHYYDEVSLDDKTNPQSTKTIPPKKLVKQDVPVTSRLLVAEPTRGQRSFAPAGGITVSLDPIKASKGLPSSVHSWKIDHVSRWLLQLSPSLSEMYGHCFSQHSITGHTLLHLNQSKLQSMGITSKEHRMQLGMSIARLRLNHEQKELEKLSSQVTWL